MQSDPNASSDGKAKGRRIGILAALGCLAVAIGYAGFALLTRQAAEPSERAEQEILDAAIARIDAESRGALAPAMSSPALPPEARPGAAGRAVPDAAPELPAPEPPEGYSFAKVETEMAKSPMPEGELGEPESIDDGLDWLDAPNAIPALARQAADAGRNWTFGWVRAAHDVRPDAARAALEKLGAQVLGASGRLLRAKLPGDPASLRALSALPEVAGLGAVPKERKLAAAFAEEALAAAPHERRPVFITLMTDDRQGRWRRQLEALGAVVGHFDPDIRAYAAHIANMDLDPIASQDFVLAVEPIGIVRAAHDTAVPVMGADAVRRHAGSPGLFSGTTGASVPIAVMDSGLNINHLDISTRRESICGANFVVDHPLRFNEADLWIDEGNHGTHVTGTIAGNGYAESRYAGMAPGVQHIRFAKVLSHWGFGSFDGIQRGMDFLARPSSCAAAGWSSARVKPLIVNMSLSASARIWQGRGVDERKLDSVVWSHRQLYVVAQSNESIYRFSNYAAAKNSLAVGAVQDSGDLASFSSHGPTADGRLAPQVVATGVEVYSAAGGGSRGHYLRFNGTSMAAPSVAGVAALLMDGAPAHRERPALARARLMASAIKPDAWLGVAGRFPADNSNGPGTLQAQYGMGLASARTSVLNRNRADGWANGGGVSELRNGEYAHSDIEVQENTSRLDLVLTWDEPPTDTIGQAVLNDLDLWLDRGGDCGSAACGEWSSVSRKDNVEWIILRNPSPGTYRAKILPRRIHGAAPRAALAWTLIRGPATPQLRIEAAQSSFDGVGPHDLTLTLTADGYVAAGTRLHVACDAQDPSYCEDLGISNFNRTREDGIANAPADIPWGSSVVLGEIAVGERQEVSFQVASRSGRQGPAVRLYFTASAWNAEAGFASIGLSGDDGMAVPAIAERPANDSFAAAALLEGRNGSLALDLRLATADPGEPVFSVSAGRPAGSLWHVWTAPADGLARFDVQHDETLEELGDIKIDIFQGDRIARLEPMASKLWGASFFAVQGETYRIRVSHASTGWPLTLHWSQGPRPENDDFSQAVTLTGAEGTAEGSNQGATLEPGELFGSLAATSWHRWIAPTSGSWEFRSDHEESIVLAFSGSAVAALRLVSGRPLETARFPVLAGEEYFIAVAARDAFAGGRSYRLTWAETNRESGNDNFANAEEIEATSSGFDFRIGDTTTVEPGEPAETGVRTQWWVWKAPEDGRYTWRMLDTNPHLLVTVFSGPAGAEEVNLEDLQLIGATGPNLTSTEFAFDAIAGQRYWIAVGIPMDDLAAFAPSVYGQAVSWAPTPENDSVANASSLAGASGAVRGSNAFATAERGERISKEGHSSLWWTWEAPAAGWYRFWIGEGASHILAAYQAGGDGFAGLDLISASHLGWLDASEGPTEILFYAEPGIRYSVRLGSANDAKGGEFRLQWGEAVPPVLLKYTGRLNPTQLGLEQVRNDIGGLTFDEQGTTLYMQSSRGLHVLERDAATGTLDSVRVLENSLAASSALVWDPQRTKLYVRDCSAWHRFSPIGENRRELRSDPFATADAGSSNCSNAAFMDPDAKFLYSMSSNGIEVFAIEPSDALRQVQFLEVVRPKKTLMSNSGEYIYVAATSQGVLVLKRNVATGELTQVSNISNHAIAINIFAVSDDERFLFAFSSWADTQLFQLSGDPVSAQRLETLGHLEAPWSNYDSPHRNNLHEGCNISLIRNGRPTERPAADVFCENWAFSIEYRSPATGTGEPSELKVTDYFAHWQQDRFNNHIPEFARPRNMTSSPDGKHTYIATDENELLFFERVGNQITDTSLSQDAPDLAVGITETDNSSPEPGASFNLQAKVRNLGGVGSAATTLRWLRSSDALISLGDEEAANDPVEALAAFASSEKTVALTVPLSAGDHYYGACVDSLADESNTGNNCSPGALFRVVMPDDDGDDEDDHGDSHDRATEVAIPSSTTGSLESPGDLDYFRITLQQAAILELYTTGSTDTYGALYWRDGRALFAEDDDGGDSVNFRINHNLAAGTYFLEVRGLSSSTTGDYSLEVASSAVAKDDHGGSRETATEVSVPSSTAGNLESPGDSDYFRIVLQQSAILELHTTSGTDTYGVLYREDGSLITEDDDGGNSRNFRINYGLAAGTYFLKVRGFSPFVTTGSYTLEAAFANDG